MTPLIDSHCHLQRSTYGDQFDSVLDRARAVGVETMVTIGSSGSVEVCREAVAHAEASPDVFATVGYHPHDVRLLDEDAWAAVADLARQERVVAVGETGLDYHYEHSPRDAQQAAFRRFLALAREVGKPVVIHNRESDDDCIRILEEERAEDVGGVEHCFTSSWELARAALDRGFYIGFTGIVTFKRADAVRDVLRRVPLDRVVVETDCPYLAPEPHRGRRNEPAYVAHVAAGVAAALGGDVEEVRAVTSDNARRLYGLSAA